METPAAAANVPSLSFEEWLESLKNEELVEDLEGDDEAPGHRYEPRHLPLLLLLPQEYAAPETAPPASVPPSGGAGAGAGGAADRRLRRGIGSAVGAAPAVAWIPLDRLRERSFELPPRDAAFAVLVEGAVDRRQALRFLVDSTKPWRVAHVLTLQRSGTEEDQLYSERRAVLRELMARATGPVRPGANSVEQPGTCPPSFRPLDRLWQPDAMIASVLLPLLVTRLEALAEQARPEAFPPPRYEIWDLGAGAGRDVAFLAEELQWRFPTAAMEATGARRSVDITVVAWDQRYRSAEAEQALRDFWRRRGLPDGAATARRADLDRDAAEFLVPLTGSDGVRILCVYAVRYWNRALVEHLLRLAEPKASTATFGIASPFLFASSHFCRPAPGAEWHFEHPRAHRVLDRHELLDMFQPPPLNDTDGNAPRSGGWTVLHDEIVTDTDHGRTLNHFVAEIRE